jgi:putative transposase
MIDRDHCLSITKQANLLGVVRSLPHPTSEADLALMRVIDELHLKFPFMGARQPSRHLLKSGHKAGRLHVRPLMTQMGIEALAPVSTTPCTRPIRLFALWFLLHLPSRLAM